MRRDALGGKRGDGHLISERRFAARPGAHSQSRAGDPSLTGCGGLVHSGRTCASKASMRVARRFTRLKSGPLVVYPMAAQLRLLIDAAAVGENRVFGLESWAADALFVRLAGGVIPSLDTVYRDLARFDEAAIADLEQLMAEQGLTDLRCRRNARLHLDIDSTVEPLFGTQQGALPGPNPHYHGRPSYHPLLAAVAEDGHGHRSRAATGRHGLRRRPGRLRRPLHRSAPSATSQRHPLRAHRRGGRLRRLDEGHRHARRVLLHQGQDGAGPVRIGSPCTRAGRPSMWTHMAMPSRRSPRSTSCANRGLEAGLCVRVIARRTREHTSGRQTALWDGLDWTTQVFLTNDPTIDPGDVPFEYNGRAGIEPLIAELKQAWALGKVPSETFVANHAMFLLKLLSHNLLRRFVLQSGLPHLQTWRASWVRRVLLCIPGRLLRSGRCWSLRLPPASPLLRLTG